MREERGCGAWSTSRDGRSESICIYLVRRVVVRLGVSPLSVVTNSRCIELYRPRLPRASFFTALIDFAAQNRWPLVSDVGEQQQQISLRIIVRNQHANTDARLLPAPHDIVVVYWRQRHTRLGPPSPSPYGHSGHGLTHDTETMQATHYAKSVSAAPPLEVPGPRLVGPGAAGRVGGARAPGQGNAAIAAAEPRWLPRRAFGDTAPPLTEGTSGARRPRARAAPGAPVCSPRRGTCAHGRRRPLTASAARVGHRSPKALHPYPMCAYHARLCTQVNQLRQSCWPVRDL